MVTLSLASDMVSSVTDSSVPMSVAIACGLVMTASFSRGADAPAHVNWLKGPFLPYFDHAFAREFEARGEARGDHRGAAFGRADIFGKPGIETAPIVHPSDEALEELARILDGPGLDALNRIGVMARPLLAPFGIGLEQVDQVVGIFDLGIEDELLWLAAVEDVTAQTVTRHQPGGRLAHGLQLLQTEGELGGKILCWRLLIARCPRQEQARFEISEPCRHHEIIGGDLEAALTRLIDESEILLDQRQNRNLREIDLVMARKLEQQIHGAFEPRHIDDEGLIVGRRRLVADRSFAIRPFGFCAVVFVVHR